MDTDATERFKLLIAMIGMLTLVGLLVITLLLVFWRRFNDRQSRTPERTTINSDGRDLWVESGQRLTRQLGDGQEVLPEQDDEGMPPEEPRDDDRNPS